MEGYKNFKINKQRYSVSIQPFDYNHLSDDFYRIEYIYNKSGEEKRKYLTVWVTRPVLDLWRGEKDFSIYSIKPLGLNILRFRTKEHDPVYKKVVIYAEDIIKEAGVEYIKAERTFNETYEKVTKPLPSFTDVQIRREILKNCYYEWQENPHGIISREELLKILPISYNEIERNLKYLVNGGYLDGNISTAGITHVSITTKGIDTFEDQNRFNSTFSLKVEQHNQVSGDQIITYMIGNQNTAYIKSAVTNSFDTVKKDIEKMEIDNKDDAISTINKLENELLKEKTDPNLVTEYWNKLKNISDFINEKILSHPIIAQLIATQLLNVMNPTKVR